MNMCVFILLNYNEVQKILFSYSTESIYIILLQEELKMEELQHIYMVQTKLTAKSPNKHSQQQVRETNRDCSINKHVIGKVLYIQPLIRA